MTLPSLQHLASAESSFYSTCFLHGTHNQRREAEDVSHELPAFAGEAVGESLGVLTRRNVVAFTNCAKKLEM